MRTIIVGAGIAAVVAVTGLALLWRWNTRATLTTVDVTLPADFPDAGFSHATFEGLLTRFVREGHVDYHAWHADAGARTALDSYLAAIARFSPENTPERFPGKHDALAYWMYAYNAFVIKAVLDRWPLGSVTDVKAPVEIVRGLGFFYTLKFVAGGENLTLYDLEHTKVIDRAQDPRVHFVLNCGSAGCPLIRPELPTGDALEPFLETSAREFVSEPRNVEIDHDARTLYLSKIFEWYEQDFVAELRRRGLPTSRGVVAYLALVAPEALQAELLRADGYAIVFRDYDWKINEASR